MAWAKLEGEKNFWNPTKVGDEIEGTITKIEEGKFGKKYTLAIVKDGKDEVTILPAHKVLQSRLAQCVEGDKVKAVYTGTQPPKVRGENPTIMYDVFRDEAEAPKKEELVK